MTNAKCDVLKLFCEVILLEHCKPNNILMPIYLFTFIYLLIFIYIYLFKIESIYVFFFFLDLLITTLSLRKKTLCNISNSPSLSEFLLHFSIQPPQLLSSIYTLLGSWFNSVTAARRRRRPSKIRRAPRGSQTGVPLSRWCRL